MHCLSSSVVTTMQEKVEPGRAQSSERIDMLLEMKAKTCGKRRKSAFEVR